MLHIPCVTLSHLSWVVSQQTCQPDPSQPKVVEKRAVPTRSPRGLCLICYQVKGTDRDPSGRFYQSGSGNNPIPPIQQNLSRTFDHYRGRVSSGPSKKLLTADRQPQGSPRQD